MLRVLCELEGVTPIQFNKKLKTEKKGPNESWNDFEEKVWLERCDVNGDGNLYLNSQRFKKAIITAAEWLNIKIEGEGQSRYQKLFRGGVLILNSIDLKVKPLNVNFAGMPDGIYTAPRKKDGKRWVRFPIIESWNGEIQISILDEKITEDIFKKVLDYAGMNVGICSWRPENGGENGRFECVDMVIEKS